MAELLPAWAPDPWHKLLARGGAGPQSWGTGAVPWGGHSPAASWAGKHQLTLGFQHHWLLLWCCSWPWFHSAPGQLLEAKGLDLPLLLIPVSDRAFPNGRARFGQTDITAQPCAWLGVQGTVAPAEGSVGLWEPVPTVCV